MTFQDTSAVWWLLWLLILPVFYLLLSPYMMGFQASFLLGKVRRSVRELEAWSRESRRIAINKLIKYGRPKRDVGKELDDFLEFFAIDPVRDEPIGVLRRLEHVLDVRRKRFDDVVERLAPKADPETSANLQMVLEGVMASHTVYRVVRHFMLLAQKTRSVQLAMIIQMQLPFLKEYAKAFLDATKTFVDGKPIGDGIGSLVAAKLIGDAKCREPIEDTVYAGVEYEGRKLLVVKAKGPGGRVGKPGELIKWLARRRKVDRIIMIDAALKLEGEASGQVVEGVGAAIGGPPTEKYKIEEVATGRKIPVDAIIIKESFKEAIGTMHKRLAKAADDVLMRIKRAMRERTKPGDTVIVAGIGNTIGIGQGPTEIPAEFPEPPAVEERSIDSGLTIPARLTL